MSIRSLPSNDILKITSSQVIIDLKSIIKELVENSIDAKSSKIEITFVNYGIDSISIQDNGVGIQQQDFPTLCLRNSTSKLVNFDDLNSLSTLGFRGEALNSICSLCKQLTIVTFTEADYPKNFSLKYNEAGELRDNKSKIGGISNKSGTLVTIGQLFSNLPVRLKNFIKNSKREFHKAINFLINYLLIYTGIKFSVYHINNSKKQLILSSRGGEKTTIIDNLISMFGNNNNKNLLEINLPINEYLKLSGHISSYSFGLGRSTQDRQFLYINRRPIIMKNLSKLINEVYKSFNNVQYPIFVINLEIQSDKFDINLTPDKSMILLHKESEILQLIREKLIEFYNTQDKVIIPRSNNDSYLEQLTFEVNTDEQKSPGEFTLINKANTKQSEYSQKKLQNENELEDDDSNDKLIVEVISFEDEQVKSVKKELPPNKEEMKEDYRSETHHQENKSETEIEVKYQKAEIANENEEEEEEEEENQRKDCEEEINLTNNASQEDKDNSELQDTLFDKVHHKVDHKVFEEFKTVSKSKNENLFLSSDPGSLFSLADPFPKSSDPQSVLLQEPQEISPNQDLHGKNFFPIDDNSNDLLEIKIGDKKFEERASKRSRNSPSHLHKLKSYYSSQEFLANLKIKRFQSNMNLKDDQNITFNNLDDKEKLFHIKKSDFSEMSLIGQFNLGFILVNHQDSNIFIIDQHASDEKYNFEKLVREFQIKTQPLIVPQQLELNIVDEMLIIEHESIFINNGFRLKINHDFLPGTRISMLSLPTYKGTIFSLDDFYELINLINEQPGNTAVKCSKIRKLLAMKACRTSIMIGSSLTSKKMTEIVKNLSTLDKPWNCPHGRPTMRHLIELTEWQNNYHDYEL